MSLYSIPLSCVLCIELVNILSISVAVLLVIRAGFDMIGNNIDDIIPFRNHAEYSQFSCSTRSMLKSPRILLLFKCMTYLQVLLEYKKNI